MQAGVSLALSEEARAGMSGRRTAETEATAGTGEQRGKTPPGSRGGRAWALLAGGEATNAQQLLLDSAEALDWAPVQAAELRYEAMRAGTDARTSSARRGLASWDSGRCDAPLTRVYAAHVQGKSTRRRASRALAASELFAALGAEQLFAAEAAAHAASAFAAEGRQDSARQAASRSGELQPEGQGAQPAADRRSRPDGDIELTPGRPRWSLRRGDSGTERSRETPRHLLTNRRDPHHRGDA